MYSPRFENGEIDTKIELIPSPGIHYFKHKNHWIQVERAREKNVVDFSSGNLWEVYKSFPLLQNF